MENVAGAISCLASGEGEMVDFFGGLFTFKVRSCETGGAFALMEGEFPGKSGPPKMHTHPAAETFRVLSGEFEFEIMRDGKPVRLAAMPGTVVHVPGGEPHLFRNAGSSPATMEIIMCPGDFEGYFLTLGRRVTERFAVAQQGAPPDVEKLRAVGSQYGVAFFDA